MALRGGDADRADSLGTGAGAGSAECAVVAGRRAVEPGPTLVRVAGRAVGPGGFPAGLGGTPFNWPEMADWTAAQTNALLGASQT